MVKKLPANEGNVRGVGSISGLGRFPGGGHDNPGGQRTLVGYTPWGCKESDMTERTTQQHRIEH